MSARIEKETRTAIAQAVQRGDRRSVVARKYGVSQSAVARIGQAAGIVRLPLSVGQKKSQRQATAAVRLESHRRRAELGLAFLTDAERIRRQLFAPAIASTWDARGVYHEHKLKEPDARGKRDLAIALAILVDKHAAIERLESEANTSIVKAAIMQLIDHLEGEELTTKVHVVD